MSTERGPEEWERLREAESEMEADAALGRALRNMAAGEMTESGDVLGGTWDDLAYVAGARKILNRLEEMDADKE